MCRALFLLLLFGARCLTIGGHSAGKVGIAAEDGVVGFLIDASHILHVGIGGCAAVGPLVGDHVQLAYLHRAGVGAEILVEQVCDGAGIRHHAGVAGVCARMILELSILRKDASSFAMVVISISVWI